jgi:homoserine/homoserine lactone efflux protein
MSFEEWLIFMTIWTFASIPLGPNALNCISASAAYGFRKGLWSVVGVILAAIIFMTLALTGIAAFLTANTVFFEAVRWAGVAYLAWMGISMLRSKGQFTVEKSRARWSKWQAVKRATLISLSNPKAVFVWLAVFTQFIDASSPMMPQVLVLGPSALLITATVYIGYCAIGKGAHRIFSGAGKLWFDRLAGSAYLAFAVSLASADFRRT